jgi:hypothetical protein
LGVQVPPVVFAAHIWIPFCGFVTAAHVAGTQSFSPLPE